MLCPIENCVLPMESLTPIEHVLGPWNDTQGTIDIWNRCDAILCCPQTISIASREFDAPILMPLPVLESEFDWISHKPAQKYASLGILCCDFPDRLKNQPYLLEALGKHWSNRLLFWHVESLQPLFFLRKLLHRAGYYEVAEWSHSENGWRMENSSVAFNPDGEYEITSHSIPDANAFRSNKTVVASKVALQHDDDHFTWHFPSSTLLLQENDSIRTSDAENIGLAVRNPAFSHTSDSAHEYRVEAVFQWNQCLMDGSFAGIVCDYSGPGDSNMFLAMVEAYEMDLAMISIWKCQSNWSKWMTLQIPFETLANGESVVHQISLAVDVRDRHIELFQQNVPLVRLYDARVRRTSRVGIRMRGRQFTVKNFSCANHLCGNGST